MNLLLGMDRGRYEMAAFVLEKQLHSVLEREIEENRIPLTFFEKDWVGWSFKLVGRINREFKKFRPHIVHTHDYTLHFSMPSILMNRTPVSVHTLHNLAHREMVNWKGKFDQAHRLSPVHLPCGGIEVCRGIDNKDLRDQEIFSDPQRHRPL